MLTSSQLQGVTPILVFEEMSDAFEPKMLVITEPFKFKGRLRCAHIKQITRVHLVHSSIAQLYAVKGLERTPHYSIPANTLAAFKLSIRRQGLQYSEYLPTCSYVENEFLKVWNQGTPEFETVLPYMTTLDLENQTSYLMKASFHVKKRNSHAESVGYANQNLVKTPRIGHHEAYPTLMKGTTKHVRSFVVMSELSRALNLGSTRSLDSLVNRDRQGTFAQMIHVRNCFEGLTFGLYPTSSALLRMYVDAANAPQPDYNIQLVASVVFASPDKVGEYVRSFCAVYSRKACSQYLIRDFRSREAAAKIQEFARPLLNLYPSESIGDEHAIGRDSECGRLLFDWYDITKPAQFAQVVKGTASRLGISFYNTVELLCKAGALLPATVQGPAKQPIHPLPLSPTSKKRGRVAETTLIIKFSGMLSDTEFPPLILSASLCVGLDNKPSGQDNKRSPPVCSHWLHNKIFKNLSRDLKKTIERVRRTLDPPEEVSGNRLHADIMVQLSSVEKSELHEATEEYWRKVSLPPSHVGPLNQLV
jgi:hypothetical protein